MSKIISQKYQGTENTRLDREVTLIIAGHADQPKDQGDISRSQIKRLIENNRVSINQTIASKAGAIVRPGDLISIDTQELASNDLEPYDFPLKIIYEDQQLIVIDKPPGISMHPGAGNQSQTVANALLLRLKAAEHFPDKTRPGIVHRLDKDTSGLVVVAKTAPAHAHLAAQFAARSVGRAYYALVFCTPRNKRELNIHTEGTIDQPLGRDAKQRTKIAVVKESQGKRAVTHWKVIQHYPYARLLEVRLETGRTHQIRVHMAHVRSPVIGDKLYGEFDALPGELRRAAEKFGRQALHAYLLEFDHPISGKRLSFSSELPTDFQQLLAVFAERD